MKTKFDKIYVISLIFNKDRQKFIKNQMNRLDLDFEFIYGEDFLNIRHDRFGKEIKYPSLVDWDHLNNYAMYGCTINHYRAILQAYEFGYKNVLIIEDDICLLKDENIIKDYFNNTPEDADFITYTIRFLSGFEKNNFIKNELKSKNKDKLYISFPNIYKSLCGTGMYAIMNRKTMELYLENQRKCFKCCDHVDGFFEHPTINRYATYNAICLDQYNISQRGKISDKSLLCYDQINIIKNYDDYFQPIKYDISNINIKLKK